MREGSIVKVVVATVVIAVACATNLVAEEQKLRSLAPGEEIRLAVLGSMKANCKANPAPDVRLSGPISLGSVRIASAKMRTNRFPQCPNAEMPVTVIFYKAGVNVSGPDTVRVEIQEASGKMRVQTYEVYVRAGS